jgi:hypothetical protein
VRYLVARAFLQAADCCVHLHRLLCCPQQLCCGYLCSIALQKSWKLNGLQVYRSRGLVSERVHRMLLCKTQVRFPAGTFLFPPRSILNEPEALPVWVDAEGRGYWHAAANVHPPVLGPRDLVENINRKLMSVVERQGKCTDHPRTVHEGTYCTTGWVCPMAGLDGCGKFRQHRDSIPGPSC